MSQTALFALVLVLFPITFAAIWSFVSYLLSHLSGWQRLAEVYGRDDAPQDGREYRWQNGKIGMAGYRNCLHVRLSYSGLGLTTAWPFRLGHRPLFIPWNHLHSREDTSIFWLRVTRFKVGNPPIATLQLPTQLFPGPGQGPS